MEFIVWATVFPSIPKAICVLQYMTSMKIRRYWEFRPLSSSQNVYILVALIRQLPSKQANGPLVWDLSCVYSSYSPSEKLYLFLDRILADRILTLLIENLGEEKCK